MTAPAWTPDAEKRLRNASSVVYGQLKRNTLALRDDLVAALAEIGRLNECRQTNGGLLNDYRVFLETARNEREAALAEIDRLREQNADLESEVEIKAVALRSAWRDGNRIAELDRLRSANARSLRAVDLYGTHLDECALRRSHELDCDCGLIDTLGGPPAGDAMRLRLIEEDTRFGAEHTSPPNWEERWREAVARGVPEAMARESASLLAVKRAEDCEKVVRLWLSWAEADAEDSPLDELDHVAHLATLSREALAGELAVDTDDPSRVCGICGGPRCDCEGP